MDMSDSGRQPANAFWSGIYAQLSEFFKESSPEFADDVASGRLAMFFRERLTALGLDESLADNLSMSGGDVHQKLNDEYRGIFLGPLPPYVVPVESIYKRWTKDPACQLPIALEKGYLMGDSAIDMMEKYQVDGIAIPDGLSSMPDHVALELEYMSFLLINRNGNAQSDFIANHLDWIGDLVTDIEDVDKGKFYTAGAKNALAIIPQAALS